MQEVLLAEQSTSAQGSADVEPKVKVDGEPKEPEIPPYANVKVSDISVTVLDEAS